MRAAVCRQFGGPLEVAEIKISSPADGEVLVDVAACAVCHSDIAFAAGAWGGDLPAVYGHEAAGVVAEVGAGVDRVRVGDRVVVTLVRACDECYFCRRAETTLCATRFRLDDESPLRDASGATVAQGLRVAGFAEQVLVHQSQLAAIPDAVPMEAAALLACGVLTGFGAVVNTARLEPGATAVVVGAGGVGLNCVQGAVHAGAGQVIVIDAVAAKLAAAAKLGATATLTAGPATPAAVADLTEGRGADYVFVAVGKAAVMEQSLQLVRRGGTLVIVGMPPTGDTLGFDPGNLAGDAIRIVGSKMGSAAVATDVPKLADLYLSGGLALDKLITGVYPLEDIESALDGARSGQTIRNVISMTR